MANEGISINQNENVSQDIGQEEDTSWFAFLDEIDEDQTLINEYERELGVSITLDQALFFLDHPDEKKKFKRKRNRIDNCGSWSNWYDPHTGKRTGYFFYCGAFRECSRCLEKRAERELDWMKKSFLTGKLNALTKTIADRQTVSKMLRGIHKDEYVRYPQSDGTDLLLSDPTLGLAGEKIGISWIMNQDWKEILSTPEGRNKSGVIHIPKLTEKPEKFSIITTQQFTSDASQEVINGTMDEVVQETFSMNPQSAEEVEDYINDRSRRAIDKLKEQGYVTSIFVKKVKVVHNKIAWQRQNSLFNNSVNTKNLTSISGYTHGNMLKRPPGIPSR